MSFQINVTFLVNVTFLQDLPQPETTKGEKTLAPFFFQEREILGFHIDDPDGCRRVRLMALLIKPSIECFAL